ncbi:flagellar protein FlgN [Longirhabdus pacifica]|uniref:flagellar protein FlgN n=1 Tax=Longirhabdus pacifica TaxID=2305227 RepID=UPI0013E8A66D|nr:flagellar protein FlgN [Longirhabdus pacifica]
MKDIIVCIQQLLKAHEQLLQLAKQKKDIIVANDITSLSEITSKEAKYIAVIETLEVRRQNLVNAYFQSLSLSGDKQIDPTLTNLIALTKEEPDQQQLTDLQQQLLPVMEQLVACQTLNDKLIADALQFLDYSVDLLFGEPEDDMLYQHPEKTRDHRKGMFETKA